MFLLGIYFKFWNKVTTPLFYKTMEGNNNKIIIYQTKDGKTSIDVKLENDTVWLSANQMADLFERDEKTIRKHVNNVSSI